MTASVRDAGRDSATLSAAEGDVLEWDAVIDANLKSVFLCTRTAARSLIEKAAGGAHGRTPPIMIEGHSNMTTNAKDGQLDLFWPEHLNTRTQDLPEAYHDTGQFYWGTREAFASGEPIFASGSVPVRLPRHLVQDIDTFEDWKRAELMFEALRRTGDPSP